MQIPINNINKENIKEEVAIISINLPKDKLNSKV